MPWARRGARELPAVVLPRRLPARRRGRGLGARVRGCSAPPRWAEASAARVAPLAGLTVAGAFRGGLRVAVPAVDGPVCARVRRPPRLEVERRPVGLGRRREAERRPVRRWWSAPATARLRPGRGSPWRRRVRPPRLRSRRLGGGGGTRRVPGRERLPRLLEQLERAVGGGRAVLGGGRGRGACTAS
jgi:hypothetical protein